MRLSRRVLIVVAGAAAAAGAAVWLRLFRCDTPNRFRGTVAYSEDGLRHYEPDRCQIDANGYRNPGVPPHADIVTIGDSNTWGVSVYADESWPRVLARETGLSTYNISMPGWGPLDYLAAMARALALTPRFVVVDFYVGNDIYESYAVVARHSPAYDALAAPFHVPAEIAEDPIWQQADAEGRSAGMTDHWTIADFRAADARDPNRVRVITVGGTTVVLAARFRMLGVNLEEPRIAYGLTVAKAVLATLSAQARSGGARLVVVIQPSKEYVYCGVIDAEGMPSELRKACGFEAEITAQIEDALRTAGIAYANAIDELRPAARQGEEIYPLGDAHPNRRGTELLGRAAQRALPADARTP